MENRDLYRGKQIDNGEWVIGNRLDAQDGRVAICETSGNWKGICPCFPDTVCRCTGLKDKNGKLIFENDILKDNIIYGVVKWDDANAGYIIDDREDGYQDYSEWWHECEIIGNIFDDPELLEVQP